MKKNKNSKPEAKFSNSKHLPFLLCSRENPAMAKGTAWRGLNCLGRDREKYINKMFHHIFIHSFVSIRFESLWNNATLYLAVTGRLEFSSSFSSLSFSLFIYLLIYVFIFGHFSVKYISMRSDEITTTPWRLLSLTSHRYFNGVWFPFVFGRLPFRSPFCLIPIYIFTNIFSTSLIVLLLCFVLLFIFYYRHITFDRFTTSARLVAVA